VERVRQARYQVPDDDTDEDLAQVPEDYGRSNKTKKLKLRLKERLGLVSDQDIVETLQRVNIN
jgi:hypothetical protein